MMNKKDIKAKNLVGGPPRTDSPCHCAFCKAGAALRARYVSPPPLDHDPVDELLAQLITRRRQLMQHMYLSAPSTKVSEEHRKECKRDLDELDEQIRKYQLPVTAKYIRDCMKLQLLTLDRRRGQYVLSRDRFRKGNLPQLVSLLDTVIDGLTEDIKWLKEQLEIVDLPTCPDAYTDTQLLDFLEELNGKAEYTGQCVLRDSTTGRGWRLHETSAKSSCHSVRVAIAAYMESQ